jgi:hypothetical protein
MSRGARTAGVLLMGTVLALGACAREAAEPANTYESRTAGFRLVLPEAWIGRYHVLEASGRTATLRRPKALQVVQFVYMPADTARAAQGLLDVTVFESADWIALGTEPSPPPGQVIAQRDGRVWVAALPAANPFPGGPDSVQYAAMLLDAEMLKRSFSLR